MEVWPHARPLHLEGSEVGVVVCHGFTGSVQSVAPWARAIHEGTGASVVAPRLSGHGTRWEDMTSVSWRDWARDVEAAYSELAQRCSQMFVAGLSMGGALALGLAEHHDVAGVLLVNPAIASRNRLFPLTGVLRHVIRTRPGIASDIRKPGIPEEGYDTVSVAAVWQMTQLWRAVSSRLHEVRAPVLLFRSDVDHVVDDLSHIRITDALPETRLYPLHNSYHVATLDNDASIIERESVAFINDLIRQG